MVRSVHRTGLVTILTLLVTGMAAGHGGAHDGSMTPPSELAQCLDSTLCHGAADMMGYNWFGMGTSGFAVGILVWALIIAAIYYVLTRKKNLSSLQHDQKE